MSAIAIALEPPAAQTSTSLRWIERRGWLADGLKVCDRDAFAKGCFHFADKTLWFKDRLGTTVKRT
jgi:hypothetical protein